MWYWPAVSNPQDEEETEECGSADDTVSPAEVRHNYVGTVSRTV